MILHLVHQLVCLFVGHREVITAVVPIRKVVGFDCGAWLYSVGHCSRCGLRWDWKDLEQWWLEHRS